MKKVGIFILIPVLLSVVACSSIPFVGQQPTPTPAQKPGGPAANAKPVTVAPATQGQFAPSLEFSGTLESSSQVNLAPQVTGRLEKLNADVGSQVKTGDVIATLESTSFRIAVQQAQANLVAAQAKLETTQIGGRPEQIASAQAGLNAAQTKLAQLQNPSASDVQTAQSAVDAAQANVNSAQAKLDQTKSGPLPADLATAKTGVDTANASVAAAQAKLDAVKNPYTQADWGTALAAVDTARANLQTAEANLSQTQAGSLPADVAAQQAAVSTAYNNLLKAQDALDNWKAGGKTAAATGLTSNSEAEQNVQAAQDAYNAAVSKLQQMMAGPLPNTLQQAVGAVTAARAAFNSAAAKVAQMKSGPLATDVAQAQDALNTAQANLTSAQAKYDQTASSPLPADLATAQTAVDTGTANLAAAQAKLNQLLHPTPYDVQVAADAVRQAEQTVALQANPYTAQDLKAAQAAVDQAQAAVDSAQNQLNQTTVVAPFNGTVTAKLVAPGAIVAPGTPVVTLASDELDVLVNFEETRLSVLKPGLDATITVGAYPGVKFPAKVASIYPSADPKTHTFIMKIVPSDTSGRLKAGMFANIVVQGETRNGIVFVPLAAITQVNGQDTVFVVVNGKAQARTVTQGAISGGNVEITSGVQPGEEVVVSGTAGLSDGDNVRVTQPGQQAPAGGQGGQSGQGGQGGRGGQGGQGNETPVPGKPGGQGGQSQPEATRPTPTTAPAAPAQKP